MRNHILLFTLSFVIAVSTAAVARAEDPRQIGEFGAWTAYTFMEDGNKVCYMAAQPKKKEGNYTRRGDVFALVTHRPAEGSKNVFSYITGYSYKADSDVAVRIDGQSYELFTQDDTAWAPDAVTDNRLAEAIRKGSAMIVKGTSARGTLTTDTFSLNGSGAAHDAITKECNAR